MAATLQDVVSVNLVLVGIGLLNEPGEFEQFRSALDIDLRLELGLVTNVQSGLTEPSRTITLNRERVSLNLSPSRSTIAREYPDKSDLARLAEVAALVIESTDLDGDTPQAFGYNIEMVFDQGTGQPAIQYLGERLFDYGMLGKEGWNLVGGTWTADFQKFYRPVDYCSGTQIRRGIYVKVLSELKSPQERTAPTCKRRNYGFARGNLARSLGIR